MTVGLISRGDAALLIYGERDGAVDLVTSIVGEIVGRGAKLGLVSRRSSALWERLRDAADALVAITVGGARPTREAGYETVPADPVLIAAKVSEVMSLLGPGAVILMDDLTDLVLLVGFAETYRLVRLISSEARERSVGLLAMINEGSNPKEYVAAMASLFPRVLGLGRSGGEFSPEFNIKAIGGNRKTL